jgi:DNA-binding transcriptional regulator YiaG
MPSATNPSWVEPCAVARYRERMTHAEVIRAKRRVHRMARSGLLAERREDNGWSQSDVARALGVNPSQVSRWEAAKQGIRGEHAVALLDLLLDGEEP